MKYSIAEIKNLLRQLAAAERRRTDQKWAKK